MTSSHTKKKTELSSQETTGQEDRKGRKEGRFEEEDEQVEVASSGQTEITPITDIRFILVFKYLSRL